MHQHLSATEPSNKKPLATEVQLYSAPQPTSPICLLSRTRHDTQANTRRMLRRPQHPMRGLLIVLRLGHINIRYELLRIAIDQRKPCALNLDHQAMTLFESMQNVQQLEPQPRR